MVITRMIDPTIYGVGSMWFEVSWNIHFCDRPRSFSDHYHLVHDNNTVGLITGHRAKELIAHYSHSPHSSVARTAEALEQMGNRRDNVQKVDKKESGPSWRIDYIRPELGYLCRGRDSNSRPLAKCWPDWKLHISHCYSNIYTNPL